MDENVEVKVEAKADEKAEVKETEAKADEKKKSLITRFLDYFNDANKKTTSGSTSALSEAHTMPPTPSWA